MVVWSKPARPLPVGLQELESQTLNPRTNHQPRNDEYGVCHSHFFMMGKALLGALKCMFGEVAKPIIAARSR